MVDKTNLSELAHTLNDNHIKWGIGGSYLLKIYDLVDDPNDLDLWVDPIDIVRVREIFDQYDEIYTSIPLPPNLHYKIKYRNTEVDFVGCFSVKPNQRSFKYNISPTNIKMIQLDEIEVPCTYLEDWYIVYRLLKRDEKAEMIKKFFKKHSFELSHSAIDDSIEISNLPKYLTKEVYNIVNNINQLTFFE